MNTPKTAHANARKPGRKPREPLAVEDLQGFKFFKRLRNLFDSLHDCAAHRNRKPFYDEYAAALLFYFFNPALNSLRGLQIATGFEKVKKALGLRRMSLGSMSESVRLFDQSLLAQVFEGLAAEAKGRATDPRLKELRQVLTVVDGTILPALPRMTWAIWLGDHDRAAKAHVQFEVLKGAAVGVQITQGSASDIAQLKGTLKPGRLYVTDRGYRDFDLMQQIIDADSSFVTRLHENVVAVRRAHLYETIKEYEVSDEARSARVTSDRLVRLGGKLSAGKLHQPLRLVTLEAPASAPRGLGYPVKRVSSKKTFRQSPGAPYTLILCTDRLDLPADVIALIYQHRWQVELFFRLLKSVFGCRHLRCAVRTALSDSCEGVSIQVYAALIATLLLSEYTSLAASQRVYFLVTMYLQGWASLEELHRELDRIKQQAASKMI